MMVYAGISTFVLVVGLCGLYAGLPLVLPFSGLEIMALGAAFYLNSWRGGVQQVITIDEDSVVVEAGRTAPETREEFQRQWARVILQRSRNGWYPSRLLIRSHGRQVEIGEFLNEQERQGLAWELRRGLERMLPHVQPRGALANAEG